MAINTTAGTVSRLTRFCIITNLETHVKRAIVDWRCTPLIAVDDPVLMLGKPPALTAATGMDALTHAVEAYVSTIATPTTDAAAIAAIKLIGMWLRPAVAHGDDMVARDMMAHAEYLAGIAFNNASLGYVYQWPTNSASSTTYRRRGNAFSDLPTRRLPSLPTDRRG